MILVSELDVLAKLRCFFFFRVEIRSIERAIRMDHLLLVHIIYIIYLYLPSDFC